jgi:MFS family permease
MLQAGVGPISQDLGITFTDVAKLAGYQLVAAGASGPFISALARKYGKRPAFVFASTMALIGCILGEVSTTYNSLIIARVFEGIGAAAYESLVMAAVGDIFFVHERGLRIAVLVFILSASGNLTLVIAGPITAHLGWHYNFHILMPFVALQWIVLILFAPETTFIRAPIEHDETLTIDDKIADIKEAPVTTHDETITHNYSTSHRENPESGQISGVPRRRKTFRQRLALYNGVFVQDSIFKMLIACPAILLNLGGAYNVLVSGLTMSWYVGLAVIGTVIFSSPPYSYTATSVGYVCVAPLIGGLLGTVFAGSLTDPIARYMTKKNKGVYEPELRLPLITVGLITTLAGIYGFGYSAQNLQSVYVIAVNWAIALFGINVIVILSTAYPLDAFREHTTEIFVMNMMFKNLFNYGYVILVPQLATE